MNKKHHTVGTVPKSSQFIDWILLNVSTSLISVICRTRTSSIIFKTYIETREGMGQRVNNCWRPLNMYVDFGSNGKCFFSNLGKRSLACRERGTLQTRYPLMVHGQTFRIITRQLPIQRAPRIHHQPNPETFPSRGRNAVVVW